MIILDVHLEEAIKIFHASANLDNHSFDELEFLKSFTVHSKFLNEKEMFQTSFIGFACNTFIAFYIRRLSLLRNSFGRLLQLQAAGDAVFVLVWAFYFAPVLFLWVIQNEVSSHSYCLNDILLAGLAGWKKKFEIFAT